MNVIDAVLLPRITDIQRNGTQTLMTMADELGGKRYFLMVEDEISPPPTQDGLYPPADKQSQLYTGGRELSPAEAHGQTGRSVDVTFYKEEMLPP